MLGYQIFRMHKQTFWSEKKKVVNLMSIETDMETRRYLHDQLY